MWTSFAWLFSIFFVAGVAHVVLQWAKALPETVPGEFPKRVAVDVVGLLLWVAAVIDGVAWVIVVLMRH